MSFLLNVKNHDNSFSYKFAIGRGLFRRCEIKLKQFTFGIGTIFCPNLGEDQKKQKKTVFIRVGIEFCDQILFKYRVKAVTFLLPMTMSGLFSLLDQKLVSKVVKTGYFAYSACQWETKPPPPPAAPGYATAFSCENRHLIFNSSSIALVFFFIDLRKKRGKMPILAAKTRPCECSFRYILLKAVAKGKPARPRPFLETL